MVVSIDMLFIVSQYHSIPILFQLLMLFSWTTTTTLIFQFSYPSTIQGFHCDQLQVCLSLIYPLIYQLIYPLIHALRQTVALRNQWSRARQKISQYSSLFTPLHHFLQNIHFTSLPTFTNGQKDKHFPVID